jgi:hypothetical protein
MSCTAVGDYKARGNYHALAEHWDGSTWTVQTAVTRNGSTWTVQQTAFPPRHKVLNALSCASASTCTAVGGSSTASEPFNDRPVAEHE